MHKESVLYILRLTVENKWQLCYDKLYIYVYYAGFLGLLDGRKMNIGCTECNLGIDE